jgi:hypothetical protein
MSMSNVIQGAVHGKRIELTADPGLEDGQLVEVVVRVVKTPEAWGEGLRRCAGAFADDPEFDAVFEQIQQERKAEDYREIPE